MKSLTIEGPLLDTWPPPSTRQLLVSVAFDDRPDEVAAFFAEAGGEWPVLVDGTGPIALDYGVSGVPESYLVAPSGVLATKIVGGVTADGLDRIIADLERQAAGGDAG